MKNKSADLPGYGGYYNLDNPHRLELHEGNQDMTYPTRRDFLLRSVVCPVVGGTLAGYAPLSAGQDSTSVRYDLLIKDGRVIDPAQKLAAPRDVAIASGKIARIAEKIDPSEARRVLDASGKIVTPGLIDVHVHVYDGVGV